MSTCFSCGRSHSGLRRPSAASGWSPARPARSHRTASAIRGRRFASHSGRRGTASSTCQDAAGPAAFTDTAHTCSPRLRSAGACGSTRKLTYARSPCGLHSDSTVHTSSSHHSVGCLRSATLQPCSASTASICSAWAFIVLANTRVGRRTSGRVPLASGPNPGPQHSSRALMIEASEEILAVVRAPLPGGCWSSFGWVVGRVGIEPTTPCLKGRRSTTELTAWRDNSRSRTHLAPGLVPARQEPGALARVRAYEGWTA